VSVAQQAKGDGVAIMRMMAKTLPQSASRRQQTQQPTAPDGRKSSAAQR